MLHTEIIRPDTGRKASLLLLCCVKLRELKLARPPCYLDWEKEERTLWGSEIHSAEFLPECQEPSLREPARACSTDLYRSQDWELQLPGNRLQEQPSVGAFGPHLFFSWFSVQVLPSEEYSCPPFPWKCWHGAQRRNTQRCTQLLSAWHFMGHTCGQTAWRQPTSVKLKWSLCKRTRNSFQLPVQVRIDRLTSVLPSNTPFPHLPHLSFPQSHHWHFLTSLFAQDFPFKARSVGSYVTGQLARGCCDTEPNLPFPQLLPSCGNDSSSKSTGIAAHLDTIPCGGKGTMHSPVARGIICPSDTPKGCRTQGSTSIPFCPPGQNSCIKQYLGLSVQLRLNS